jgi:hypothetical protein
MFQFVTLTQKNAQTHDNFMAAWKDMYVWVKDLIDRNEMSYQVLETAIWIEQNGKDPIFFYDARDKAIDEGWKPE